MLRRMTIFIGDSGQYYSFPIKCFAFSFSLQVAYFHMLRNDFIVIIIYICIFLSSIVAGCGTTCTNQRGKIRSLQITNQLAKGTQRGNLTAQWWFPLALASMILLKYQRSMKKSLMLARSHAY